MGEPFLQGWNWETGRPHSLIEPRRKVCKRRPTSILPQVQRHNMLEKKKSLLLVTEARLRMRRLSLILGSLVEPLCPSEQPQQRHSPGNIRHGRVLGAGKESSHSSGRPCQHLLRFGRCCPRETGSRPVQCGIPGPLLLCMAGPVFS